MTNQIDAISSVHIFVNDQDRAKKFYTEVMGFELHSDQPFYPGAENRWIAVAPKGAKTELVLLKIDPESARFAPLIGTSQALTLNAVDAEAA